MPPVISRVIRLALDINVLYADFLAAKRGFRASASSYLVEAVRTGECEAGPVQLIVTVPMIENWSDVMRRRLGASKEDAEEIALMLHDYATDGPLTIPPNVVIGAGFVPFSTDEEARKALIEHAKPENEAKLFDEISGDRYVLMGALAGKADILTTTDIGDFNRGSAIGFKNRNDVLIYPTAGHSVVIGKPAFVAHHLRSGVIPDLAHIRGNPLEFEPAQTP